MDLITVKALIITIDGGGVDYNDGRENSWSDLDSWPNSNATVTATTFWIGKGNKIIARVRKVREKVK